MNFVLHGMCSNASVCVLAFWLLPLPPPPRKRLVSSCLWKHSACSLNGTQQTTKTHKRARESTQSVTFEPWTEWHWKEQFKTARTGTRCKESCTRASTQSLLMTAVFLFYSALACTHTYTQYLGKKLTWLFEHQTCFRISNNIFLNWFLKT